MPTEDGNSLAAKIRAVGMYIGNQVLDAVGLPVTASKQLWVDFESRLQSGAQQPFAVGAAQSTITSPLFNLSGKATPGILTSTIVQGSDVTTATKANFVRVDLSEDSGLVPAGSYYIELFTIT